MSVGTSTTQVHSQALLASDGTACVIFYDGTNLVFFSASSPYSSWSSSTTITATNTNQPDLFGATLVSGDSIYVVYENTGGHPAFRALTKSGTTWTVGSENVVDSSASNVSNNNKMVVLKEPSSSRLWMSYNNGSGNQLYYSDNTGSTWTNVTAIAVSQSSAGAWGLGFAGGTTSSAYLVSFAGESGGSLQYSRHQLSAAATSWSALTTVSSVGIWTDHTMSRNAVQDSTGRLMIAANPSGTDYAIRTLYYTASTDTWSSNTDIGASTSDKWPDLATNGTDIWCVWSANQAANNYSVVYKKWTNSSATWDSSSTTLVASGANNVYSGAGYGNNTVGVGYTTGTANPYSINFASFSTGSITNNSMASTDALVVSDLGPALFSWHVDALTASDLGPALFRWPVDALTASDLGGSLQQWNVDGLSAADTPLFTDTELATDALTVSDLGGNLQRWPVDALSVSDALLGVDSAIPVDALTVSDVYLATDTDLATDGLQAADLGGNLQRWPVDALTASDSLLGTDSAIPVESLSAGDVFLQTDTELAVEALSAGDLGGSLQRWPVDALSATDSLSGIDTALPVEALSAVDVPLDTDTYLPVDQVPIADAFSAGPTNNSMASTDSLVVSDSFSATDNYQPSEALTVAESLAGNGVYVPLEAVPVGESLLGMDGYLPLEALSAADALTISDIYVPTEVQGVVESLLATDSAGWVDILSISDTSSMVSVATVLLYLSATWKTRDGTVTWKTRDLTVTVKTRDEQDTWNSRDELDTWKTRDEQDTWKTRS